MCPHRYMPNASPKTVHRMLDDMGLQNIESLFSDIPSRFRLGKLRGIPDAHSEAEVRERISRRLERNAKLICPPFLGGGTWPHYVPAVVEEIVHRAEFLTSYTPYQAEISQGILQALFEYQSLVCELVGLDVANASMYDWSSSVGEAARMCSRLTRRDQFIVPKLMHPERLKVLQSYAEPAAIKVSTTGFDKVTGQMDLDSLSNQVTEDTAGIYVENPSYLGYFEEAVNEISNIAHDSGALFVVGVDPISLGISRAPGEYGADIVVGEGQPLGNAMNFGGPLLGLFACRDDPEVVRQMPGRIVGLTQTSEGDRGFCITLQTREQHIRRERATSNICTNEALLAVAGAVYLSLLGPHGLRKLGEQVISRSNYALRRLSSLSGLKAPLFEASHFKEFTIRLDQEKTYAELHRALLRKGIHGGKYLSTDFPDFGESALFCVTEIHSRNSIDTLVDAVEEELGK